MKYRRPNRRFASSISPSAKSRRMRVAVMGAPSSLLRPCAHTCVPMFEAHASRSRTVPAARAPNLKSNPTCRNAGGVPSNVCKRNSSGLDAANSRVNGSITTASTPVVASMARRSSFPISFFKRSGWKVSSGSISNVSAMLFPPLSRAVFCAQPSRKRCPRCTPSKTPKAHDESLKKLWSNDASTL